MFVDVILPLALDKTFTYSVNEEEYKFIVPGMRVVVPFGKNKHYTGLVVAKHQNAPILYEAKDILQLLDEFPIVTQTQIEHWFWLASYYLCTIGDVYKAALPSGLLLASETIISANKQTVEIENVSDEEYLILEALQYQSSISLAEIEKFVPKKKIVVLIQGLLQKGLLQIQEEVQEVYKPKLVKYLKLNDQFSTPLALQELLITLTKAPKQKKQYCIIFNCKLLKKTNCG